MGERLKTRQCTRLNLATKTEREINLRFQESKEERFANYGINLELWSVYRGFSLLRSAFSSSILDFEISFPFSLFSGSPPPELRLTSLFIQFPPSRTEF
ncbi:hypothetical protein PRUPE_5G030300 [Prunus persica]|uniref:Uncharacterized protein n=1 Tax=Prunus persica TaxID=3760 RepID=A0A251P4J2_PRUPE|nr:hypothetical protein PRUPE_5G030300 [Prunus persica]